MTQWRDAPTRIKGFGPVQSLNEASAQIRELQDIIAKLAKELDYIINGNLDVKNIRSKSLTAEVIKAGSITAEEMTVDKLSAITADLGTITAGLLNAVKIYGSYIATSEDSYPRVEVSTTEKQFKAARTPTQFIEIEAEGITSASPVFRFVDGSFSTLVFQIGDTYHISSDSHMMVNAGTHNLRLNGAEVAVKNGVGFGTFPANFSSATSVVVLRDEFNALQAKLVSLGILA
ncbi:hypothetical protein [Paenibacillus sp. L3-i20]|uniref:hypothetical protein n=1 Tax=Paenibacillus sp. L3-i20 TaxID=2905833 RepID=UPI001EE03799|nr:hypothetical protein [Paenibacillus sp. L3-i20]GKU76841.1 hypothetical protein L3i20_v212380 [Paenibacillus sp. L3-i20]